MKRSILIPSLLILLACNNSKKETDPGTADTTTTTTTTETGKETAPLSTTSRADVTYSADGVEIRSNGSLLVSKDKDNLQPGLPYLCILTSNNAANNNESLVLNFLLDTKPGTYPIVGYSFQRGKSPNDQLFGGILGGKPKLTGYKVNITECIDLGSNSLGGHKWSISGNWEEFPIKAMGIMLMDKTKNHPAEVIINKGSFTGLTFDDNFEEMMEKAMEKMKEK